MISIPKNMWLIDTFAEALAQEDIIRQPLPHYHSLTDKEKDDLRQTEVFLHEIVQLLGVHEQFSLIRKYDQTLGWIPSKLIKASLQKNFVIPKGHIKDAMTFLNSWKGTDYIFGGISKKGIDCSGFTQAYYLNMFDKVLPKNSFDQRKIGTSKKIEDAKDHDLIFCRPKKDGTFHHVVLYYSQKVWHSRRTGGVVCQTLEEFINEFNIEDVRTLN